MNHEAMGDCGSPIGCYNDRLVFVYGPIWAYLVTGDGGTTAAYMDHGEWMTAIRPIDTYKVVMQL